MNDQQSQLEIPPRDIQAEMSVLSAIIAHGFPVDDIASVVQPDDFQLHDHQQVFRLILDLHRQGKPVDAVTLSEVLKRRDIFPDEEIETRLLALIEASPHAAHAAYHAKIVREKSQLRQLIYVCGEIVDDCYRSSDEAEAIIANAEARFTRVTTRRGAKTAILWRDGFNGFLAPRLTPDVVQESPAVPTGLVDLDTKLRGGFRAGQLIVLGAATSVGKTALAGTVAVHVAESRSVLVFSREMNATEIFERLIPSAVRLSTREIEERAKSDEPGDLFNQLERHQEKFLAVDDFTSTISGIESQARTFRRKCDLFLVVIDYLQLVNAEDKKAPRHQQVAEVARRLKNLAQELGIAILALSQLSRQADESERPTLKHLRESGEIEQASDVVLLLSRQRDSESAVLDVAKQRSGSLGAMDLVFLKEITRYECKAFEWQTPENFDPAAMD